MSPLLKKSFKSSKCKTLAKLTLSRIKLLRNKKLVLVKQSRKDVSDLLRTGQLSNARIRVENVHREENSLAAYELIQQYCEVVVSRLSTLESQKQCPSDMKEPIASLIYAAQRCADLPELQKMREIFTLKYGKEFTVAAAELRQDCGVSVQIIQNLSSQAPNGKTKLKLLKEIAAEHSIAWDFSDAAFDSFKISEDVLDGPSRFVSATEVSQTKIPAQAVSERENSNFSYPVNPSDGKGSSGPAPSLEAHRKTFLSPYASSFQDSPSSISGFPSSDSSNEVSNMKGKSPPHGKHDSLRQNRPGLTRFEADTRTKLQADNGVKSHKTSEVGVDAKSKTEGIMDYKNMENPWIQRSQGHGSLKSEADPYERAKAEGRMDYGNPSFKAQTNKAHHNSRQKEEEKKVTQEYTVPHFAPPKAEEYRSSNEEKSYMRSSNEENNGTRSERDLHDKSHNGMPVFSHETLDGNLVRHTRPPSLKLTKSLSDERKDGGSPYPDVATAAQVAFESAALAAEAAKAAIDMVNMDSRMNSKVKTEEADSLERQNELKSKLKVEKVAQAMRKTHVGIDSKQILERDEYEQRVCESDDETIEATSTPLEEIVSPSRADVYSSAYQRSLEPPKLHTATGMENHAVRGNLQNMQKKIEREQERILSCNQETSVSGIDDKLVSQGQNFDEGMQNFFANQKSPPNSGEGIQQDEPDEVFGSTSMHQSTSCQMKQFGNEAIQQIPSFDDSDYESDEATDTDTPFYTKGRATVGEEEYGQIASSLSVNKSKNVNVFPRIKHPISLIDHGSDSGEESMFENLKFKTKSDDGDFVQRKVEWDHSGKPEFDNEEPMGFSVFSIPESTSQSLFRGHNHSAERLKRIDDDYTVLRGKSSESDKYSKPDKTAHRKLTWQSSTSEEHGSPSQSGELSSEGDELYLANLHSHNENEARDRKQGWDLGGRAKETVEKKTHRKLTWHSSASDEFDIPSQSDEPSPEADEFGEVKLPSQNENWQRLRKPDIFIEPQENRRPQTAEPFQAHAGISSKPLRGKSFYGESRRSVRSSLSQQRQELPSEMVRYESVNSSLPSIFEAAYSDERNLKT